jgi:hypothetical protein
MGWFRAAQWGTGIYLVLVATVVALRSLGYEEWLLGMKPSMEPNAIGDTLAGTFAPLVFLWFFVSTWLQRTELEETRQVLAEQGKEMQKSAQESAKQTTVLQSRETYEEHRQRLYYLAAFIMKEGIHLSMEVKTDIMERTIPLVTTSDDFELIEDNSSVDYLIQRLGITTKVQLANISSSDVIPIKRVELMSATADLLANDLSELVKTNRYRDNPLIAARIRGTGLDETVYRVDQFAERVRELLAAAL